MAFKAVAYGDPDASVAASVSKLGFLMTMFTIFKSFIATGILFLPNGFLVSLHHPPSMFAWVTDVYM